MGQVLPIRGISCMSKTRNKTKRRKAGRPRKAGERYTDGKLKKASVAKNIAPTTETLIHREAVVEGAFDKPSDSLPGHALGILLANKWLNTAQYDAAMKFEGLYQAFRQAIAASRPHAKIASYGDISQYSAIISYDDEDESEVAKASRDRDQAIKRAYLDALSVLDGPIGARTASETLTCVLQTCLHDTLPWWFVRVPASTGFEGASDWLLGEDKAAMFGFRDCLDCLAVYWRERRAA